MKKIILAPFKFLKYVIESMYMAYLIDKRERQEQKALIEAAKKADPEYFNDSVLKFRRKS